MTTAYSIIIGCGLIALAYGIYATIVIMKADTGNERMREIAAAIQEGARACLLYTSQV